MSFEQFSLSEPRIKAIQDADTTGMPAPTPVQAALIPLVLTGKELPCAHQAAIGPNRQPPARAPLPGAVRHHVSVPKGAVGSAT